MEMVIIKWLNGNISIVSWECDKFQEFNGNKSI